MKVSKPRLMKDEREYLEDFQLAIDALRGVAAQHPDLTDRLNAIADKCQHGYGHLRSAFEYEAQQRHQHRLKTDA